MGRLSYFGHFWKLGPSWVPPGSLSGLDFSLDVSRNSRGGGLILDVGSLLGPCWVLTFRRMSQLLVALLEVRPLLVPDFSWDVQATFGTFGS